MVNFRTDPPSEQALAELTADGRSTSDSVRGDLHRLGTPRDARGRGQRGTRFAIGLGELVGVRHSELEQIDDAPRLTFSLD